MQVIRRGFTIAQLHLTPPAARTTHPARATGRRVKYLLAMLLLLTACTLASPAQDTAPQPTTPQPTAPATPAEVAAHRQQVLHWLQGISGKQTVVGIENKNIRQTPSDTDRMEGIAGKRPALWGADFGFGHHAVDARQSLVDQARAQWQRGALISLMYHTCAPTRDELCEWDDIGGKHPVHLTDAEWSDLLTPGTALNKSWLARLDGIAAYLQQLQSAGVIVLFRPFHEMNQCVFWWSCHTGPNGSARLYQLTHDYFTNTKGLHNILWVWNVQDFPGLATDVHTYNPGPSYYDLATLDVYDKTGYTAEKYSLLQAIAAGKPIALAECRYYPALEVLASQPGWTYAMLWPDFIEDNRASAPAIFASPQVITLDKMPGWH